MSVNKSNFPIKNNLKRKLSKIIYLVLAAIIATGVNYYNENFNHSENKSAQSQTLSFSNKEQQHAISQIQSAKNNTHSQFWVGFNGEIVQILKDDLTGSRHQKFIISPTDGITLLVAHNIDLAPRAPVKKGDFISLYGRYEWNNRGGVVHWTHHDPKGKKKGGWINVNGKKYH